MQTLYIAIQLSVSYNCSFDGGLCSLWNQDSTDDVDWTRYQGSTPDHGTGPSRDHTTGKSKVKQFILYK